MIGRQAEAIRNDRRVLQAAREVFAEQGFDAPVSAVAARAGVGMGTLYRRYGGKEELLQHLCVLSMQQNLEMAEDALAAEDPWEGLCRYIRACVAFEAGAFSPVAGKIETTEEMLRLARAVQRRVNELTGRAQHHGSLRSDVNAIDILLLIEHFSRAFPPGSDAQLRQMQQRQLEIAISGLRAGAGHPLSGPVPQPRDLESRWR